MWQKSPSAFIPHLVLWEVGSGTQNRKHRWDRVASVYPWSIMLWFLVISTLVLSLCSLSLIWFLQRGHNCCTYILKSRWQTPKSPNKLLGIGRDAVVTAGRNTKTELPSPPPSPSFFCLSGFWCWTSTGRIWIFFVPLGSGAEKSHRLSCAELFP